MQERRCRIVWCNVSYSTNETATNLGEIKEGEVTRKDHGGTLHEATSPTSTEIKTSIPEIVITAPKKEEKK